MATEINRGELELQTRVLFSKDVRDLPQSLVGLWVRNPVNGKTIRLDQVSAFPADVVGTNYKRGRGGVSIDSLRPGQLWTYKLALRKMTQFLVGARDGENEGACVRVVRASRYDPDTDTLESMPREGDIARHLELEDDGVFSLEFQESSTVLSVVSFQPQAEDSSLSSGEVPINPVAANQFIQNLFPEDSLT